MTTQLAIPLEAIDGIRNTVAAAFDGFIGNESARRGVERSLMIALAQTPTALSKTFLFSGPPSSGKTEMFRRIAKCLGAPTVETDGRAVKSRDGVLEVMDSELEERERQPQRIGSKMGLPVLQYERMLVFIDEIHGMSQSAQQGFLPLLERDGRSAVINNSRGRYVASFKDVAFVFATTEPSGVIDALRTRCTDIVLESYTAEQIIEILKVRREGFAHLPPDTLANLATSSRLVPRIAIEMATEVLEEMIIDAKRTAQQAFVEVTRNRGVLTLTGLTRQDLKFLRVLAGTPRPMAERSILSHLQGEIDRDVVRKDVEPFLIRNGYVEIKERGRALTWKGDKVVKEFE